MVTPDCCTPNPTKCFSDLLMESIKKAVKTPSFKRMKCPLSTAWFPAPASLHHLYEPLWLTVDSFWEKPKWKGLTTLMQYATDTAFYTTFVHFEMIFLWYTGALYNNIWSLETAKPVRVSRPRSSYSLFFRNMSNKDLSSTKWQMFLFVYVCVLLF